MNCLEFRRLLLSDPLTQDAASQAHEAECPACAAFAREVRANEVRMRALLQDVTVPDGLVERIQLAARFEQRATTRRRWWYGIAAGVLIAVGASMLSVWTESVERGGQMLAQSVINHIEDEADHLREAHPISATRVNYVLARFGAELAGDIGPVHFAAECLMRERNGVHLVLPGKRGAITVFLMPGEMADDVLTVESARFAGQIVPTPWGSIAVVGENGEQLGDLGERLAALVRWPTEANVATASALVGRRLVSHDPGVAQQQDS